MDKRQEIENKTKSVTSIIFLGIAFGMLTAAIILIFLRYYYFAMIPLFAMVVCAVFGIVSNMASLKLFDSNYRDYISEKETEEKERLAKKAEEEKSKTSTPVKQKSSRKKKRNSKRRKNYKAPDKVEDKSAAEVAATQAEETISTDNMVSEEKESNNVMVICASGEGHGQPMLMPEIAKTIAKQNEKIEAVSENEVDSKDSESINNVVSKKPVRKPSPRSVNPPKQSINKSVQQGKKIKTLNPKKPETPSVVKQSEAKSVEPDVAPAREMPKMANDSAIIDVAYLSALVDHEEHDNVVIMFYTDKILLRDGDSLFESLYSDINMLAYGASSNPSIALSCKDADGKHHTFVSDDKSEVKAIEQIYNIISARVDKKIIIYRA